MSCATLGTVKEVRESVGALLNLVKGVLDRSQIVYDDFDSVTNSELS